MLLLSFSLYRSTHICTYVWVFTYLVILSPLLSHLSFRKKLVEVLRKIIKYFHLGENKKQKPTHYLCTHYLCNESFSALIHGVSPKECTQEKAIKQGKMAISITWVDPEDIMLSEISQTEKDTHTVQYLLYMEPKKPNLELLPSKSDRFLPVELYLSK